MDLNFIDDVEIDLAQGNDLLATTPYVNTLEEIIKTAKTPFTIGLFGGWGSGKSSVVHTIQKKFNDKNGDIWVFKYDAWKYSEDSFRRTFILKLREKALLEEGDTAKKFYSESHKDIDHKSVPKEDFNSKLLTLSPAFGLIFLVLILISVLIPDTETIFRLIASLIAVFITIILFLMKEGFIDYKISISEPKTFAPEQFETAFNEAIENITSEVPITKKIGNWFKRKKNSVNAKKIVIVIDNIDRCHKEMAFKLLLTIKNFLGHEKVLFLLPIDEKAVKKHIDDTDQDGNEFLRKLFNTTLSIRKFSVEDLFQYTKDLQKKHSIGLSNEVVSLIAQEFSSNPRKIIQFLNSLQTEIKLVEEQEALKHISTEVGKNLPFLTKILLIREEWPELFEFLKSNPYRLNKINNRLISAITEPVIIDKYEFNHEQIQFLTRTRHIHSTNIDSFFLNKDSLPNIPDQLNTLIESQDWNEIRNLIESEEINFEQLSSVIENKYHTDVVQRKLYRTTGINIYSLIFKIIDDEKHALEFKRYFYGHFRFYGSIKADINSTKIDDLLPHIDPRLLMKFIKSDENTNKQVLLQLINFIKKQKGNYIGLQKILTNFIQYFEDQPDKLAHIQKEFSAFLKEKPHEYLKYKTLLDVPHISKAIIEINLLNDFINDLNPQIMHEQTKEKAEIISVYDSSAGLNSAHLKIYMQKVLKNLQAINDFKNIKFWLERLTILIPKITAEASKEEIRDTLESRYELLKKELSGRHDEPDYTDSLILFLDAAYALYLSSGGQYNVIIKWIEYFINQDNPSKGFTKACEISKQIIVSNPVFNLGFKDLIIERFRTAGTWDQKITLAPLLDEMLNLTTNEEGLNQKNITDILNIFIDLIKNHNEAKDWLMSAAKNPLVKENLKELTKTLSPEEKMNLLELIKTIDIDFLHEHIGEIILDANPNELAELNEKLKEAGLSKEDILKGFGYVMNSRIKEKNNEYQRSMLNFLTEQKMLNEELTELTINKLSSMLTNETEKEVQIFALKILISIDIPQKKKQLINEHQKILKIDEFSPEEKILFDTVLEKTSS